MDLQKITKEAITKHPYAKPGAYPVTVQVTDKHGQTADAGLTQRVSDPSLSDNDPSRGPRAPNKKPYGGKKGKGTKSSTSPVGKFGTSGGHKKPPPQTYPNIPPEQKDNPRDMPPDEIGDEFRNVVHDAVSKALIDPNKENQQAATKTATVMTKLDPSFMNQIDPEAKRRYEFGLKPVGPHKPLPEIDPKYKKGGKALHEVRSEVHVDVDNPVLPDI